MRRTDLGSIRGTFLLWLSLILFLVIGGFGASLSYLVRRSKIQKIDTELEGTARLLVANFRRGRPRRGPGGLGEIPPELRQRRFNEKVPPWEDPEERIGTGPDGLSEEPGPGDRRPGLRPSPPDLPFADGRILRGDDISPPPALSEDGIAPYYVIWAADGTVLDRSEDAPGLQRPDGVTEGRVAKRQRGYQREVSLRAPRGVALTVGKSIEEDLAELGQHVRILLATGAVVLAVGIAGGWLLVRRALRPIQTISAAAESISGSSLSKRIDVGSTESELGRLAQVLNTTFDRLQLAFEQQARFAADASHELRTPVAVILAQTDMARRKDRSPEEYRAVVDACHSAAERMRILVDGLLTLTQSDARRLDLEVGEVDLTEVVEECAGLVESLAKERQVVIERDLQPVTLDGDAHRIAQVVTKLLANAVDYNRQGGWVRVRIREEPTEAVLTVEDSGIGIASEDIPRIFERFFRVDASRSSRRGGCGLGLAISKAIVEAHRGAIDCRSRPGEGSAFTVRLPRAFSSPDGRPLASPPDDGSGSDVAGTDGPRAAGSDGALPGAP